MEWRHSGSPRPKISECKNPLEKFSPRYLGSRRHPPHWLSSKRSNYQHGVLLSSAGTSEGHFERKTPREATKVFLFLHDNAPPHRALATQKKLAYLSFHCLDPPPYFRIWPRGTSICSLAWKITIEKSQFFALRGGHFCRGDLVGWTNFWFFLVSCKI